MCKFLDEHRIISITDVKKLLMKSYPSGLSCHYYPEFFGTLRSMFFDVTDCSVAVVFGTPKQNKWFNFTVAPLEERILEINLCDENAPESFYRMI